jgi:hypothetical protein
MAILITGSCLHVPWRLIAVGSILLLLQYAAAMLAGRHSGEHPAAMYFQLQARHPMSLDPSCISLAGMLIRHQLAPAIAYDEF